MKIWTPPTIIGQHSQRTVSHLQPLQQYIFANIPLQPEEMNVEHLEQHDLDQENYAINDEYAYTFGEALVSRGTDDLPFNLLKVTTKVPSARLGPRTNIQGDLFGRRVK